MENLFAPPFMKISASQGLLVVLNTISSSLCGFVEKARKVGPMWGVRHVRQRKMKQETRPRPLLPHEHTYVWAWALAYVLLLMKVL